MSKYLTVTIEPTDGTPYDMHFLIDGFMESSGIDTTDNFPWVIRRTALASAEGNTYFKPASGWTQDQGEGIYYAWFTASVKNALKPGQPMYVRALPWSDFCSAAYPFTGVQFTKP